MNNRSDFNELIRIIESRKAAGIGTTIAIDGCAAAGKTTLAAALSKRFSAPVVHMDDFFLRPEQRTPERYAEPGGNVDYERFAVEVLPHAASHDAFSYFRFDCKKMASGERVDIPKNDVLIVEGSYSCHVNFIYLYDIKIFLKTSKDEQQRRIIERNGADRLPDFTQKWIPLEQKYFDKQNVEQKCDFVFCN